MALFNEQQKGSYPFRRIENARGPGDRALEFHRSVVGIND